MSNHEELLGRLENPITEDLHGYAAVLLGETMGLAAEVIREQQAEVAHWQQAYRDSLAGAEISKHLLTAVCEARQAEIERLRDALAHFSTDETPEGWIAIAALEGKS